MAKTLKSRVLQAFKNLHRTRLEVFKGDAFTLEAARDKINDEFKKNKKLMDKAAIHDAIIYADTVAHELKTTVIQAEQKQPGIYQLKISKNTLTFDNKPFDPNAKIPKKGRRIESSPCSDTIQQPKPEKS